MEMVLCHSKNQIAPLKGVLSMTICNGKKGDWGKMGFGEDHLSIRYKGGAPPLPYILYFPKSSGERSLRISSNFSSDIPSPSSR